MKYVIFSDIHFGLKSNSDEYNKECLEFLEFVKNWSETHLTEPYETIFMGDWYNNRNSINVKTLNYGKEGLVILSNIGDRQYVLLGNHDLYFLDKRDIHSIVVPDEATGIEVITEPIMKDNILLVPWLIGDENLKDLIAEHNPDYVFGHFEIPSFKFNQQVVMEGEYNPFDYQGPKMIYSGHFHTMSEKDNIKYIGNCFSQTFADVNDWHNKGFIVLDTETGEEQRVEFKLAPKYYVSNISEFNPPDDLNNAYVKLINDKRLDNETIYKLINALKETGRFREIQIIPVELDITGEEESIELKDIGNMNTIIPTMLSKVEMEGIDPNKLINIYNNLEVE